MMTPDVAAIAAGLTKAQRLAILCLPETPSSSRPAGKIGVAGQTLMSLNPYGFDGKTLIAGPVLATYERLDFDGKRHWWLTEDGLAVRAHLLETQHG